MEILTVVVSKGGLAAGNTVVAESELVMRVLTESVVKIVVEGGLAGVE